MKRINKKTPAIASAAVFLVLLLMFTSCEKATNPVEPKAKTGIGSLFTKSNDFHVYANLMTYIRESHYIGVTGSSFQRNPSRKRISSRTVSREQWMPAR